MVRKVLVSLPEDDLRRIDAAARERRQTRSAFIREAALGEAARRPTPNDDPAVRRTLELVLRRAELRERLTTEAALAARDRGRR